jgi:hypothetical protein
MNAAWQLNPEKNPDAPKITRRLFPRLAWVKADSRVPERSIAGVLGSLWYRRYTSVLLDDSYASMRIVRVLQQRPGFHLDYLVVGKAVRPKCGCSLRHYQRVRCDPAGWLLNSVDVVIDLPVWVQQETRWLAYA